MNTIESVCTIINTEVDKYLAGLHFHRITMEHARTTEVSVMSLTREFGTTEFNEIKMISVSDGIVEFKNFWRSHKIIINSDISLEDFRDELNRGYQWADGWHDAYKGYKGRNKKEV